MSVVPSLHSWVRPSLHAICAVLVCSALAGASRMHPSLQPLLSASVQPAAVPLQGQAHTSRCRHVFACTQATARPPAAVGGTEPCCKAVHLML